MSSKARRSSTRAGLNVIPADDLDDAAKKIVAAVKGRLMPMPPRKINLVAGRRRSGSAKVFDPHIAGDIEQFAGQGRQVRRGLRLACA